MAKQMDPEPNIVNRITQGTVITGDIETSGDIRIDGRLVGQLTTEGKLVIGETGFIKGEIHCKSADVFGKIEGKITIGEQLSLRRTANLLGDITTSKLAIEPGAIFSGSCSMDSPAKLHHVAKSEEKTQKSA